MFFPQAKSKPSVEMLAGGKESAGNNACSSLKSGLEQPMEAFSLVKDLREDQEW